MRIDEFTNKDNTNIPFNVIDDVCIFMRNEPMFYRKQFFPLLASMSDKLKANKPITKEMLAPVVEKALNVYCNKFSLPFTPEEILSKSDKESLIQKLFDEEMPNIKKGIYECGS